MTVSAIITTRNRRADLLVTLAALSRLSPAPDEILVCLDGCTDDSAGQVAALHPEVRLIRNESPQGSIPSRRQLISKATGDLVLSLDDDSHPVEPDFLSRSIAIFSANSALAVLFFPQRTDEFPSTLTQADFGPDLRCASYASSGAIIRRSAYESLPGYCSRFGHAYEEPDFGLQCIGGGWEVRTHTSLTIRHYYSPRNRDEIRIHHFHARNEQWSILMRCPSPWWPLLGLRRASGQFIYALRRGPGWLVREPRWWWGAVAGAPAAWRERRPVPWSRYRTWLRLLRRPEPMP